MFRRPRPNLIESSEGFTVEVLGRVGLRYTEAGKSTEVGSEVLVGNPAMAIYKESLHTWSDGTEIDDITCNRIIHNIRKAIKFEGFDIDIL